MQFQALSLPTTGVHLYESKHQKGKQVSGHYHDHFQILYALDGEGKIIIDGNNYDFSKDQVVLIVPNSVHSIQAYSKLTVLVLAYSDKALPLSKGHDIEKILQLQSQYFHLDLVRASEIRQLLRKMLFEQTNYDSLCCYTLSVYLMELLVIIKRLKGENHTENANDMRAGQMKEYIDTHYFENISAEELSLKFGISPRYINEIFKSKYHETPLQYLQKVRINRAKALLLETDKDIVSICFEVGYETLSPFYRTFRNLVGMSPHKFRTS